MLMAHTQIGNHLSESQAMQVRMGADGASDQLIVQYARNMGYSSFHGSNR